MKIMFIDKTRSSSSWSPWVSLVPHLSHECVTSEEPGRPPGRFPFPESMPGIFVVDALIPAPSHQRRRLLFQFTRFRDKADGPISFRSASEGEVARLDFPGTVQRVYIRSESRKDSSRETTGSRPPSGVHRATLFSYKR
ncbi:hypothetical protein TNCV_1122581 [Trichonephila clavipes]|uniref:Uncharacterized protein n=1 Tax=Trichonephila clavipes TaxID=2585209 RepID=A0A8X6SG10_TRICX|nr:hypothetical protein TNCV_1122581 [Trichonephila clavipes]